MMTAPAAHAAGGCSVSNTASPINIEVELEVRPLSDPPVSLTITSPNLSCSYVSGGGQVNWTCSVTGRCEIDVDGVRYANCTSAGATCTAFFFVEPGQTVELRVYGGSGSVADAA